MATHATAERLLQAAEALIAERGPDRVSVRDITTAARANVAAVSYHFGSKRNLVRAMITRNAERFGSHRAALFASAGSASLESLVRAMVQATAELAADPDGAGRRWLRCKLQLRADHEAAELLREAYWPFTRELLKALAAVTPHLSTEARVVRYALARDAIDAAFAADHYPPAEGSELGIVHDALVDHLVAFLVPAFEGPG